MLYAIYVDIVELDDNFEPVHLQAIAITWTNGDCLYSGP